MTDPASRPTFGTVSSIRSSRPSRLVRARAWASTSAGGSCSSTTGTSRWSRSRDARSFASRCRSRASRRVERAALPESPGRPLLFSMVTDAPGVHAPLTVLSDDESMFREAVAGFAEEEVRPRVQQMERDGKIDPALVKKYFEMGLMGIEVAEEF